MKLTIEDIKKITQGATDITDNHGRVKFYRFTEAESATYECEALSTTTGVQLEFVTDASELELTVYTTHALKTRSFFCVDVFVDDNYIGCIKNFDESRITGAYSLEEYELGSFKESFSLGEGDKKVRVVLPHSIVAEIEELELLGATYFENTNPAKTVVMYGDSITQGYDAVHPSRTYAVQLARLLNATLYNKGISGAPFVADLPKVSDFKNPDYVGIAYGTNDWNKMEQSEFTKCCSDFMKNVSEKYPNSKKFVITPIWRADFAEGRPFGDFSEVERIIKDVCKNYPDIKVISGWNLVPHKEEMYGDLRLHPSDEGFSYYFKNLKDKIKS